MTRSQILSYISALDGWLSLHEGFFLYETARKAKRSGVIVEIGSWKGKSTICLAAGTKLVHGPKITAVDPHKGEYTRNNKVGKKSPTFKEFQENLSAVGLKSWVHPVVATSKNAAKSWKKPISLLFIDGLHDYKNTHLDYSLWSPFVMSSGIIAFHDAFCGHSGPEKIVQEIISMEWKNIGVVGSIIFFQRGKAKTLTQHLNVWRHRVLIPLALKLNKSKINYAIKFFIIHRVIKLLLLNSYTFLLQLEK